MAVHVFTGPTLHPGDPALADSRFVPRPPIGHGDLLRPGITPDDTVLIIDGVFHHAPAVRHKEIIWTLSRGVRVLGAASIGALRAAELANCGMVGVGEIYTAYATGELAGDDEVAVAQAAAPDLSAYSWPLVNVRKVLRLAVSEGVIDPEASDLILAELKKVFYAHRSLRVLLSTGRNCGAPAFGWWLKDRLHDDPYFGDVKRADAVLALETALNLDRAPSAAPPTGLVWNTRCFRRWHNEFTATQMDGFVLKTRHRVAYQQIFDPDFKSLWHRFLRRAEAQRLAPALACVAVRPDLDLAHRATVDLLLRHETRADRAAIMRCLRSNEERTRTHPGFFPEAIRGEIARTVLSAVWSVSGKLLEGESWERGFQGEREAVDAVKPFVLGILRNREQV
ncbi:TfuA-like protein [Streptomyces sp. NPDC094448]|uniref:TfuA-like protein n=1 Tax=Streptomyces sp. NPDC094448 TaxID=3366063 RepID=UPI0038221E1E